MKTIIHVGIPRKSNLTLQKLLTMLHTCDKKSTYIVDTAALSGLATAQYLGTVSRNLQILEETDSESFKFNTVVLYMYIHQVAKTTDSIIGNPSKSISTLQKLDNANKKPAT